MNDTHQTVEKFNKAFNAHDINAVMDAMTDDCIFESTSPAPDGIRYVGAEQEGEPIGKNSLPVHPMRGLKRKK